MTVAAEMHRPTESAPARGSDLAALLRAQKDAQRREGSPDYRTRMARLDKLERLLVRHQDDFARAIATDYGNRSKYETLVAEVFVTLSELRFARSHLREWMSPEGRRVGMSFFPGRAEVQYQPLGVVGIISPWNYPLQLALAPLVGALAAGNRAMIKPSELVPETAALMARLLAEAFPADVVTVVTGGTDVGEAFAKLPFDHLVFTGSTRVGKLVMRAASENLVPVTLELGGKSPVILGRDFPADTAAARILMGKLFNSGQTCVAPDYLFVPDDRLEPFVRAAREAVADMYPTLVSNPDYTCVINDHHHARLGAYVEDARKKGAEVIELNPANERFDGKSRKFPPTLVLRPTEDMAVMQEEIFGPILPIKTYGAVSEAIEYVNEHPRPLALYCFSHDDVLVERVLRETISGGVSVNETMLHVAQDDLPFGGVGASGMGHYHGYEGFETFSKKKPIFYQSRVNATSLLRPPFGKLLDRMLKVLIGRPG
jgi:coniferyl-aldehyde dehydrogenase